MKIGGIQKVSLVDYPGKVAAVIFTIGCNFRCGYCHNPGLVLPNAYFEEINAVEILSFLERRAGKLDAVVVSGGEPTAHKDLPGFIRAVRDMGYAVKLDTQGSNPGALEGLVREGLLDYIAMDIKGPLDKYPEIAGLNMDTAAVERSVRVVMGSGLPYEFRTTVVKSQLAVSDFYRIGELITGAERYALQRFKSADQMIDSERFRDEVTHGDGELMLIQAIMRQYVNYCVIR